MYVLTGIHASSCWNIFTIYIVLFNYDNHDCNCNMRVRDDDDDDVSGRDWVIRERDL